MMRSKTGLSLTAVQKITRAALARRELGAPTPRANGLAVRNNDYNRRLTDRAAICFARSRARAVRTDDFLRHHVHACR